ncbi:MAG: long-chain-fatty-acid--CoA ligase, partial [Deferribacterales bacterium]|nr:long-chain-fatty-acid--CoA ligase [Deferribacterales bacterium]
MTVPKSVGGILTEMAVKYTRRKYLFFKNQKVTFSQAEKICNKLSRVIINAGLKKGDRVALMLENSPFFIYSLFAVLKAGGVVVPVNTFLKEREVAYIIENCESKILITSEKYKDVVKGVSKECKTLKTVFAFNDNASEWNAKNILAEADSMSDKPLNLSLDHSDLALIIYTSGTTGEPKGAMLSHGNIVMMCKMASDTYAMNFKDRFLLFLPMFHIYSLVVTIVFPTFLGASIVILESVMDLKKKNFKNILIFKRPTVMVAVPSVYSALVKAKMPKWFIKFFYPVKVHLSSGSGLPVEVFNAFKKKFGRGLLEGYGLSEASPLVAGNSMENPKAGSVGKPPLGVKVKIVDGDDMEVERGTVGEIIVSGSNIMQGYWKKPKETADVLKNGWFFTGDLGYMDDEGNISIVDRKKDLILVKGMNVYPREVEELVYKVPGVEAAAVIGIPDEEGDEVIVAYVKKAPEAEVTEKSIKQFLKQNLANFKIPKHIYFSEDLPLTTIGKVLKRKLKEMVLNGQLIGPKIEETLSVAKDKLV